MRARQRFAYNGYDLTAHVAVTSVSRSILPSRRLNRQELPGADGELAVASGLDSLEIKVACSLKASTLEEVSSRRRMLSAELLSGGAAQLILPDEPHLWLVAIYEGGAELSRNANMPSMELTFLVPDPVAYADPTLAIVDLQSNSPRQLVLDGEGVVPALLGDPDVGRRRYGPRRLRASQRRVAHAPREARYVVLDDSKDVLGRAPLEVRVLPPRHAGLLRQVVPEERHPIHVRRLALQREGDAVVLLEISGYFASSPLEV